MPVTQDYRDHFYDPNSGSAEAYLLKLENEAWAAEDPPALYLTDILQEGMWREAEESYAIEIGGITYWWAPFEITEPNISDEEPRGTITIGNVNNTKDQADEIGARIAMLTTPIKLTINIVLKSDPTILLTDPLVLMDVTAIRGNRSSITGDAGWPKLSTEPYPWESVNPSEFRCAFRAIT
jgi:hypothetical protein